VIECGTYECGRAATHRLTVFHVNSTQTYDRCLRDAKRMQGEALVSDGVRDATIEALS
jgi:hypothetical protein